MIQLRLYLLLLFFVTASSAFPQKKANPTHYYPEVNQWQTKTPEQIGMNAEKLAEAIAFAKEKESKLPRNLEVAHYQTFGKEPFGDAIGPFADRGDATGLVLRNGYIIAEWGDPYRVDMTFSVTKSFLSTVVGLAYDKGLIKNIYDTVYHTIAPVSVFTSLTGANKADNLGKSTLITLFNTKHNRTITWDHLLRQTSDWEGTLWGKPDWADRPESNPSEWTTRARNKPGTV